MLMESGSTVRGASWLYGLVLMGAFLQRGTADGCAAGPLKRAVAVVSRCREFRVGGLLLRSLPLAQAVGVGPGEIARRNGYARSTITKAPRLSVLRVTLTGAARHTVVLVTGEVTSDAVGSGKGSGGRGG
jgi:hypothetical protein